MSSIQVWRLCAARHAGTAFSGEGAELYGGRWSPPGIRLVYCAESRALSVVEILATTGEPERLFALNWVMLSAEVPDGLIEKPARVPDSWRRFPHARDTQAFGAKWAKAATSAVLRVPSAVVPGEFNYLLNPAHPQFPRIKLGSPEPFTFDPRLRAKSSAQG